MAVTTNIYIYIYIHIYVTTNIYVYIIYIYIFVGKAIISHLKYAQPEPLYIYKIAHKERQLANKFVKNDFLFSKPF